MWGANLHDQEFVKRLLKDVRNATTDDYKTHSRILGMLTLVSEVSPYL